jgi:pimeloyl-ACP methyl ester carboxylesterase
VKPVPQVQVNGISLYCEQHGEGAPILCIHGTSSSAVVWGDAVEELARRGRCIAYDRRGCFRSERPDPYESTDVGDHTDDAAALLDALSATPAVVIGRSYGGEIALDLAHRYPTKVKAIALLEPAMLSYPDLMAWARPVIDRAMEAGARDISTVAETFLRDVAGDEGWESFSPELQEMFRGNGPAILAELRGKYLDLSAEQLGSITQPALVVSAQESPDAFRRCNDFLVDALPNATSVLVDGNHLISPAHRAVLEFVDRFVTHAPLEGKDYSYP